MKRLATALACVAATCGSATVATTPAVGVERPPTVAEFAITYERSGGLRPMPYRLAIRPGRHGTLTTEGTLDVRSRTVRFRVSREKVARLRDALARAHFATVGTPNSGACADCFSYTIRYQGREVTFSDVNLPKPLRETVGLLETLVDAHRPRH